MALTSPPHVVTYMMVAFGLFTITCAGPLGPLPNVTSVDLGLKEGGCTVGDVLYGVGEEVPGGGPCERCRCAGAAVRCERARCEPRPGCKALHRPDHCCPTYQCECEQEGRVYGNGEKLVDPQDPCRVCYCQGGEVVCRRIACFVRDDCSPRLVPGRCCPEYDNCPLRGVTVSGLTPAISAVDETPSSPALAPKENIKQEITIKEITPVSEIPVLTQVKVKEILPSPGIEVPDYSSSKSPLIVREATTENIAIAKVDANDEAPAIVEIQPPSSTAAEPSTPSDKVIETSEINTNDSPPSKISLSKQDSINSELYPSSVAAKDSPPAMPDVIVSSVASKTPLEEEDPALFDHNPAFPPIPDDLSVLGNHEDDILPEQTADADHNTMNQEPSVAPTTPPATEILFTKETGTTPAETTLAETPAATYNAIETSSVQASSAADIEATSMDNSPSSDTSTIKVEPTSGTETIGLKSSPMLNLRSAIPTEILNVPSFVPEEINGEPDEVSESTTLTPKTDSPIILTTEVVKSEAPAFYNTKAIELVPKLPDLPTEKTPSITTPELSTDVFKVTAVPEEVKTSSVSVNTGSESTDTTMATRQVMETETTAIPESTSVSSEQTKVVPEAKSSIVTEITAQTEFSSLPIETSDQNPQENSEIVNKERSIMSTVDPSPADLSTARMSTPLESEIITVSKEAPSNIDNQSYENIETTEFVLTHLGSSETSTNSVELIKISADPGQSAAIIESTETKKNNVLTDLIKLVDDVASIGEHTEGPTTPRAEPTAIADSEELIPVNAGYKSKNNNWNLNSITEIPLKSKSASKQKIVEIEDEDNDNITDSPPPNDKVEPTTRRPVIDHVSDDGRPNNDTDNKDIEIITKSYVPTISRRPTKVVMKKSNERAVTELNETTATQSATSEATSAATSEATSEVNSEATAASTAPAELGSGQQSTVEPSTADPLH